MSASLFALQTSQGSKAEPTRIPNTTRTRANCFVSSSLLPRACTRASVCAHVHVHTCICLPQHRLFQNGPARLSVLCAVSCASAGRTGEHGRVLVRVLLRLLLLVVVLVVLMVFLYWVVAFFVAATVSVHVLHICCPLLPGMLPPTCLSTQSHSLLPPPLLPRAGRSTAPTRSANSHD